MTVTAGEKADEATATLFHSVSRIHRKLDKVISGMAFMDVRLSRNQESECVCLSGCLVAFPI